MKLFWHNHAGRENICDETLFANQCAIRMGAALELSGGRSGLIFFRDGWGTTDHIDVWDGEALVGGFPSYFESDFKELWFWDLY